MKETGFNCCVMCLLSSVLDVGCSPGEVVNLVLGLLFMGSDQRTLPGVHLQYYSFFFLVGSFLLECRFILFYVLFFFISELTFSKKKKKPKILLAVVFSELLLFILK